MTIKTLSPKQTEFILIGATGKLGKSITENNIITYGICSKKNPLVGKKIDRIKEPLLSSFEEINLEKEKRLTEKNKRTSGIEINKQI